MYITTKVLLVKHIYCEMIQSKPINDIKMSNNCIPTLDIQKFSGKIDDWYEFEDQFTSIIHKNDSIDKTQKKCII